MLWKNISFKWNSVVVDSCPLLLSLFDFVRCCCCLLLSVVIICYCPLLLLLLLFGIVLCCCCYSLLSIVVVIICYCPLICCYSLLSIVVVVICYCPLFGGGFDSLSLCFSQKVNCVNLSLYLRSDSVWKVARLSAACSDLKWHELNEITLGQS
jgi:hypothetical protein